MAIKVKAGTKKKPAAKKTAAAKKTTTKTTAAKTPTKKSNAELSKLIDKLNDKLGAGALTLGVPKTESGEIRTVRRIPTGSIALDIALGGGIPVGRFTEISGAFSTTKSTQCIHIVSNAQEMGLRVAFIDAEGTTDEPYLKACGVDTENLIYYRPKGLEEAGDVALELQRSGMVDLIIIDSIAALSPTKEQNSTLDESVQMGLTPRLLGEYFRKFNMLNNGFAREGKPECTVIAVNQLREKIGAYGDPEYTPGGRAKGFAASVDIRLRRGDWITQGKGADKEVVGQVVKFKIEKNKLGKRMQSGEFDWYYAENTAGVLPNFNDNEKSAVICGIQYGLIDKAGSWFTYNDKRYQGVPALVDALRKDPDLMKELYDKVLELSQIRT